MSIAPEDHKHGHAHDEPDLTMPEETQISLDAPNSQSPKQAKNWESKTPLMSPVDKDELKKFDIPPIPLLPDNATRVDADMEAGRLAEVDVSDDSVNWYQTLLNGFKSVPAHGLFESTLADPNAHWKNALVFSGQNINVGRPKFSNKGKSSTMSSERLTLSVRSKLGLGAPQQIPMVGSGFYATVKPMGEEEIIGLWRDIVASTIKLGRVTHGLLFSNNQVFTAKSIAQAFVNNMVETTVSDLPAENIYDHLTINDLPIIAHELAGCIYPNGFPMSRAVMHEGTKLPKEELEQIIDVRKTLFMNNKMFNDAQLSHMVKRIGTPMTLKSVKDYRDQFVFNQDTIVDIGEGIKLHLHTPSLREYFDSGEKWINEITSAVAAALGEEVNDQKRAQYISQLAKSSRLRQYAHYVKAIEEDGELYSTRENVDKTLVALSASDEISKKFNKAIFDYISNTQVAMIATTSVNEYEDEVSGEKWPRLIAMDAISIFFQLVERKLDGIMSRALEDTSA